MVITKTDFTGFTFDGIHTSELNVYRVSDGDRYDEELIPEINDRTTEIPGNNGEYFWGSNYGKRSFTIKIAYDEVTEVQFRKIRRLFSTRKVVPIIFDERPYKVYYVKMESPIELNYICFDEPEFNWVSNFIPDPDDESNEINPWIPRSIDHKEYTGKKRRIYKGEGTIELVAYYPYAHQLYKILDMYREDLSGNDQWTRDGINTRWTNVDEWALSSGLLDYNTFVACSIDKPTDTEGPEANTSGHYNKKIPVYNPGDENTGFYLYFPYNLSVSSHEFEELQNSYTISEEDLNNVDQIKVVLNYIIIEDGEMVEVVSEKIIKNPSQSATIPIPEDNPIYYLYWYSNSRTLTVMSDDEEEPLLVRAIKSVETSINSIKPKSGNYIIINGDTGTLELEPFEKPTDTIQETGILINTVNGLIEGVRWDETDQHDYVTPRWTTTGNVYNDHIHRGDFPKILRTDWPAFDIDENDSNEVWNPIQAIWINCAQGAAAKIHYNYLYY